MKKTNAARRLDKQKIAYRIKEYPVDVNDLSAINVAEKVAMPVQQLFKTLVARGDRTGIVMACIPGGAELDLKSLANVSGNKKVEMVHLKEVQDLTGYIRGGVSPLGAKKDYPVFIDDSAVDWTEISISAGQRGAQLIIAPQDLVAAVKGTLAALTRQAE